MIVARKRPVFLMIMLVLGFIGIVFSIPSIFSPFIKRLGDWFPALFGALVSLRFISLVGVWYMKKWGVRLFIITFIISQILSLMVEDVSYFEMGFSALLCIVFLIFYHLMDDNL